MPRPQNTSARPTDRNAVKEKRGHVCSFVDAKHPSERWETAFIYVFILKFTNLRSKVEGFESVQDLEDALLSPTQHPVLMQILTRFALNLKPQTRNLNPDQVSSTLSAIMQEHMKSSERTVFWNSELRANVEPLQNIEGGFWGADWDIKLRVLRHLVELQLSHSPAIKEIIDRAWGVAHNKHRKREGQTAPPDATDPHSVENLSSNPIGMDKDRKRYWVFDESPRVYLSTNPWKTSADFKAIANNREEYLKVIEELKKAAPEKAAKKMTKVEQSHSALVTVLEGRVETIDNELARVAKVRRKLEQKELLKAQAELRSTRTRRQTRRPDYVYQEDYGSDDDGDDYKFQDEHDEDEQFLDDDEMAEFSSRRSGRRRSQRTSSLGKRQSDGSEWRGERRSARLGFAADGSDGPSAKRARTEDRSASSAPSDSIISPVLPQISPTEVQPKQNGAASVKPTEMAVEQVAGKKKSKFWFYAVEPAPTSQEFAASSSVQSAGADQGVSDVNGHQNGGSNPGERGIPDKGHTQRNGDSETNGIHFSPASTLVSH